MQSANVMHWTTCTCMCFFPSTDMVPTLNNNIGIGRHSGLMVSELHSGSSGSGSSPGQGHCVVFLSRTLYSLSASLQSGV